MAGLPEEVLALLTAPDAIARWAPVAFDVVDFGGERLTAGDRVWVEAQLGGRSLAFEVDVTEAANGHLVLTATGPIRLDVEYHAVARGACSDVHATVTVSGSGLLGRLLARATDALLAAGALHTAIERIGGELRPAFAA